MVFCAAFKRLTATMWDCEVAAVRSKRPPTSAILLFFSFPSRKNRNPLLSLLGPSPATQVLEDGGKTDCQRSEG